MSERDRDANARAAAGATLRRSCRAVVVGVGTVGLHRALAFDDAGLDVVGYDVDESLVADYRRGRDGTETVGDDRLAASDCSFTADPACVADADVVTVSVPTGRGGDGRSLELVRDAAATVGEHLTAGTTVVLESTVHPGGVRGVFAPALERASGLDAGREFAVAHSPERLSPGGRTDVRTKLVGADDPAVARDVADLYGRVHDSVHVVDDPAVAAAAKCVENVYRDVTIALVNELAAALDALELDADAVLDAAATKWNVPRLDPGLVGGTCLPVDPELFAARAARAGAATPLVRTARAVNEAVPARVADEVVTALGERGDPGDSTVLLLGLAYKADVADLAGSRCVDVAERLADSGADVVGYDPLVSADRADRTLPFDVTEECSFRGVDAVAVLVGHEAFDSLTLADVAGATADPPAVVDVPRVFDRARAADHGVSYRCP
ncbi:nucleotide sugar dehydrogenase [Halobacterium litoreum]|uniref:UDP-N-acetyl-D-mannosamine dehydrogenase n=1 Tax=Halobacterium litoreum TaxID=2039234 RepID=A0ABD5NAC3_9EURY|nr:nucleotide sugar dehydrogenase [Halobacterium litoreum]UHH12134.1 nucleotide sugar dehydrogenase [Halobacterium litoreum]